VADRVAGESVHVHTGTAAAAGIIDAFPATGTASRTRSATSQLFHTEVYTGRVVRGLRHPLAQVGAAFTLTAGWVVVVVTGTDLGAVPTVAVSGVAVLGGSFLLAWGAETAEKDVPRAFAIAVLAVLAVAPEYAVDALYAWNAGAGGATTEACSELSAAAVEAGESGLAGACHDANLAVANMTGANRILIGIGWAGIAVLTVYRAARTRDPAVVDNEGWLADAVALDRDIATEVAFLFLATAWAFVVPLGGGIDALDTLLLVGLYVVYIGIVIRGDIETEEEQVGVPRYLQAWSLPWRPLVVLCLFAYSGAMIFTAVEPFAHGLEDIGIRLGIPEFFMIQWIAPLASESPELIVVVVLVNKARSTAGFNALISSKLNQWTLLIGTLSVVFSLAYGQYGVLPFDAKQAAEVWITAAQSYFALAVLVNFEISVREALTIFGLFSSQVFLEFLLIRDLVALPLSSYDLLLAYTAVYVVAGTVLLVVRRQALKRMLGLAADAGRTALGREPVHPEFAD
jgi:cation:H+ antiporter